MVIDELEDEYGCELPPVDTDTASREELAKACVVLHMWWTHVGKTLDGQDEALAACGLSCDEVADVPLTIVDREQGGSGRVRPACQAPPRTPPGDGQSAFFLPFFRGGS